jgi:histidyl-tRNA synthetase
MKVDIVKGFKDYTGEEAIKREEIKKIIINIFEKYGFNPVDAPIIEYEEFVKGDNSFDEAISDIFKLKDKGKRNLALRYEHTFQLKRLMQGKKLPYKRFAIGPVFRDEPAQKNRFRQFTQCDVDIINSNIKDEAEILKITKEVMNSLNIDFVIYFNNRKLLNEILDEFKISKKQEVIKELDKLDKISFEEVKKNLKKYNAEKVLDVFKKDKNYFKKYSSFKEIEELEKYCKYYDVEVEFLPSLARGLSYYNGSVFEVKTSKVKETITAGGSFIFNDVQSCGISFGLDRLSSLADIKIQRDDYLVVSLNQDKEAIKITKKLRENKKNVSIYYGKPTKALEYANSYNIKNVVFVGEKEVESKKFIVKNMDTGDEKELEKF